MEVREGSGVPPRCPVGVRRLSRRSRWVRRPSQRSGRGWEALPDVRQGSAGPPEGL